MDDMKLYKIDSQIWGVLDKLFAPDCYYPASYIDAKIKENFGLEFIRNSPDNDLWNYQIVDEEKFVKFLLKYG